MSDYPKCINGHLLTDSNFYVSLKGKKRCRKCAAKSGKEWKARNRKYMREYLRKWRAKRRKK